jgi:hypothetical protein
VNPCDLVFVELDAQIIDSNGNFITDGIRYYLQFLNLLLFKDGSC